MFFDTENKGSIEDFCGNSYLQHNHTSDNGTKTKHGLTLVLMLSIIIFLLATVLLLEFKKRSLYKIDKSNSLKIETIGHNSSTMSTHFNT